MLLIPDPSLILLIGPSGAGKSTFAARHFRPTEVISSDRCRAMIVDDEADQSVSGEAFRLLHQIARARLARRRLTVIDATNLQSRARRPLRRLARDSRTPLVAMVFNLSLETALARNRTRPGREVDEQVIAGHCQELAQALRRLPWEGYQQVYLLDEMAISSAEVARDRMSV